MKNLQMQVSRGHTFKLHPRDSTMKTFVGRANELAKLKQLSDNMTTNLVIIRGRRRIGKSRLITEFAQSYTFYEFEGLMPRPGMTAQNQRDEFARALRKYFGLPGLKADN